MEYIILWNPYASDGFVHRGTDGQPQLFGSYQDAYEEALRNVACNTNPDAEFRQFVIFRQAAE